jgi:ATP-binding cassette subfamily C (CFTR/MRP) protein 1
MEMEESPPIFLNGSLAYVQQFPWIQNRTIRENILGDLPLDKARYYDTIKACELLSDFASFKAGDQTEIG